MSRYPTDPLTVTLAQRVSALQRAADLGALDPTELEQGRVTSPLSADLIIEGLRECRAHKARLAAYAARAKAKEATT